jgi:hypothetical protein
VDSASPSVDGLSTISVQFRERTVCDSYKSRRSIRILIGVGLTALLFGHVGAPASAQDANPEVTAAAPENATPPNSTARPALKSYKPYFVEFRARSAASYGHMYVIYGQVNGRGEIVKSDIVGLHPAGDANNCANCSVVSWTLGHVFFVPSETGASDGDLEEKYVSARYRVMVDAATFKRVSEHISKLKAEKPMWNALWKNCVSFGNNIAETIGLKTPTFIWLEPKDYVEDLRQLNGGKPQRPLKFAAPSSVSESMSARPNSRMTASKPKKQPMANLPASQAVESTSGTTH